MVKQLNTLILMPALCALALCLGSIAHAAPTVTIAKPAVALEWVGDIEYNAFIKAYASDPNGIAYV